MKTLQHCPQFIPLLLHNPCLVSTTDFQTVFQNSLAHTQERLRRTAAFASIHVGRHTKNKRSNVAGVTPQTQLSKKEDDIAPIFCLLCHVFTERKAPWQYLLPRKGKWSEPLSVPRRHTNSRRHDALLPTPSRTPAHARDDLIGGTLPALAQTPGGHSA